jgi:eukaryotic-like serine/threonine-protein kinase
MLVLTMVVVAMVSALTAMRLAIHGQEVQVPAVIGLTPVEAERAVSGLGLQVDVERQYYSPQIPEGKIITQLPLAGTRVRRGWQLRVAESMGPQRVSIPDVTGQSEYAAELNIRRRGLELSSVAEMQTPGAVPGQVLAQSPPANAGQVAAPKTSILITTAASTEAFVMPSFIGQTLANGSRALQDAGFKLGNVSVTPPAIAILPAGNPSATSQAASASPLASGASTPFPPSPSQPTPASFIVAQTPPAGQKVLAGAVVNFEVK